MKESFEKFYLELKKDRKLSSWSNQLTLSERAQQVKEEVNEVLEALNKKDLNNLQEELGDVLWDVVAMIIIAEEQYGFDFKEIIEDASAKLERRKPWIKNGEKLSPEEELEFWKKGKAQEKNDQTSSDI